MKKCGFIAILGETNSGKSTLVNKMVGQKVSIVSRKIQTTVSRILGIAVHKESQIILIDTPGFLRGKNIENLQKTAWDAFRESDDVLFLVDVMKHTFDNSIALLKKIHESKKVSLVLNKIDLIYKPKLLEIIKTFNQTRAFENIFLVSAMTGDGVEQILEFLSNVVQEGEWFYQDDSFTDSSFEKYVSEITREHIFHRLHQEIPYKCAVKTENYQAQDTGSIKIVQNIYVANESHRSIFLGKKGLKIRAIGMAAREELTELLGKTVHLFLHVKINDKHNPCKGD